MYAKPVFTPTDSFLSRPNLSHHTTPLVITAFLFGVLATSGVAWTLFQLNAESNRLFESIVELGNGSFALIVGGFVFGAVVGGGGVWTFLCRDSAGNGSVDLPVQESTPNVYEPEIGNEGTEPTEREEKTNDETVVLAVTQEPIRDEGLSDSSADIDEPKKETNEEWLPVHLTLEKIFELHTKSSDSLVELDAMIDAFDSKWKSRARQIAARRSLSHRMFCLHYATSNCDHSNRLLCERIRGVPVAGANSGQGQTV